MNIRQQLNQQRVKHIVSSYQLEGQESNRFDSYLEELLQVYPHPLVELALIETLIDQWLTVPLIRGVEFLAQTHGKLRAWEDQPIVSTITPEQFQQIAGLDPTPIFGAAGLPAACSILHPS
jgi:hypothetical protein